MPFEKLTEILRSRKIARIHKRMQSLADKVNRAWDNYDCGWSVFVSIAPGIHTANEEYKDLNRQLIDMGEPVFVSAEREW